MSPGNPARLLRLVDREFRELTGEPARTPPPVVRRAPTATSESVNSGLFGIARSLQSNTYSVFAVSLRFSVSRPALTATYEPQRNQLLAALSPTELERLNLQLVPMALGQVLHESGDVQRLIYFPTD